MHSKSHTVKLRSTCTLEKFIAHVNRFFLKVNFKKNYLSVQIYFYDENGKSVQIGEQYFLNVSNVKDLKTYKLYISKIYNTQTLKEYDINIINNLVFEYTEYTKKDYISIVSNKTAKLRKTCFNENS